MGIKKNNSKIIKIGTWITLGHFSIVEILAKSGFDWLCVDLEHSVIDLFEAEKLIATIESNGCIPYVRVSSNDKNMIKRVLDAGAKGIIVPMVNSRADAIEVVENSKYPPTGKRGVGLARAQGYGFNFKKYKNFIDNELKIIVQIEHHKAIDNLSDILGVEGIDGTIIGPYDLSGSIGMPGDYNSKEVKALLDSYEKICSKFDKDYGFHVIEPDHRLILKKIKKGYTFLGFSLDTLFLGTLAKNEMAKISKEIR